MGWAERAEDELDEDLATGRITQAEFNAGMRDIRDEMRSNAEDAAQEAYDNEMGRW